MGLGIAIKAFSAALFNADAAGRIRDALDGKPNVGDSPALPAPDPAPVGKPGLAPVRKEAVRSDAVRSDAVRSDAVTLLSALQREARLVDLIQEDLSQYSDAQVGAAARPCLKSCASVLSRLIGLAAVNDAGEGAEVEVADESSAARYQWIGEGSSPRGKLIHQGWRATHVDLPKWTGRDQDADIVAPAQVQRS